MNDSELIENPEWHAAADRWDESLWARRRFQQRYPRDYYVWPAWGPLCDRVQEAREALDELRQYVR